MLFSSMPPASMTRTLPSHLRYAKLSAELPLLDSPTLYQWVGDWPGYLSLILIVLMAFVRRREPEAVSAS